LRPDSGEVPEPLCGLGAAEKARGQLLKLGAAGRRPLAILEHPAGLAVEQLPKLADREGVEGSGWGVALLLALGEADVDRTAG
jgi:hypothetical protein